MLQFCVTTSQFDSTHFLTAPILRVDIDVMVVTRASGVQYNIRNKCSRNYDKHEQNTTEIVDEVLRHKNKQTHERDKC